MVKQSVSLVAALTVMLVIAPMSLAQERQSSAAEGSSAALAENAPTPPDFALNDDGQIVVGGDVVVGGSGLNGVVGGAGCPSLAQYIREYGEPSTVSGVQYELNVGNSPEQTRNLVDLCEQPSTSSSTPSSSDAPKPSNEQEGEMLPSTGGIPLLPLTGILFAVTGIAGYYKLSNRTE